MGNLIEVINVATNQKALIKKLVAVLIVLVLLKLLAMPILAALDWAVYHFLLVCWAIAGQIDKLIWGVKPT